MNDLNQRYFFGDTLEQAVMRAASHFELDPDEVAYQRVEKRHGFLRLRRRVVIEVDPDRPRRERIGKPDPLQSSQAAETTPSARGRRDRRPREGGQRGEARSATPRRAPARRQEGARGPERAPGLEAAPRTQRGETSEPRARRRREPSPAMIGLSDRPRRAVERFPEATGPAAEAAAQQIRRLIDFAGLDLDLAVLQGDDRLEIEVWGADEERVVGQDGRLLYALEHLLPRLVRAETGEGVACRVDCGSFHEIREEQLRDLAQRAASEVARRGRSRILAPMRPDERRIVHLTLADDPSVVTESQGHGLIKRVEVRPARNYIP